MNEEKLRQDGRQEVIQFLNSMLDERVDDFVKKYPEKKNSPEVVMVEELKHTINTMYNTEFMDWKAGKEC